MSNCTEVYLEDHEMPKFYCKTSLALAPTKDKPFGSKTDLHNLLGYLALSIRNLSASLRLVRILE